MTTAVETKMSEKEVAKAELKARETEITAKEKEANRGRSGKGLRVFFGMTRGRNPQMISYENWDLEQPATLAETLSEFKSLRVSDEKEIVRRLILGDNEILYSEASDPVAEYYESDWDKEFKTQFRTSIKNYSAMTGLSIEDTVTLLKPGIVAALAKFVN